jgi:hypothetical protein
MSHLALFETIHIRINSCVVILLCLLEEWAKVARSVNLTGRAVTFKVREKYMLKNSDNPGQYSRRREMP